MRILFFLGTDFRSFAGAQDDKNEQRRREGEIKKENHLMKSDSLLKLERKTRLELATLTLARLCSTN